MRISDWSSDVCSSDLSCDSCLPSPLGGEGCEDLAPCPPSRSWVRGKRSHRDRARLRRATAHPTEPGRFQRQGSVSFSPKGRGDEQRRAHSDRQRVVSGERVSAGVELGGSGRVKTKKNNRR